MPESDDALTRGMKIRRQILGDAHVDRATANQTEFDADFQSYITANAWGSVWAHEGLDLRTRHLVTLALLAGLGREHEQAMHLRRIRATGVTQAEVREAFFHVALYAGVPLANGAFALAKQVFAEPLPEDLTDA